MVHTRHGMLALAHNGELINAESLRKTVSCCNSVLKFAGIHLTLYLLNSFFRRFSGHSLREALFVYRLIVATLIGIFLMIHSKIKIESFAKRCHIGTLGGKGLIPEAPE